MAAEHHLDADDIASSEVDTALHLPGLATMVLDPNGRVTQWSLGATGLFGHAPEQAIGADVRELLAQDMSSRTATEALADAAAGRIRSDVRSVECADGSEHEVAFRWELLAGREAPTSVLVTAARTSVPALHGTAPAAARERSTLLQETFTQIGSTLDMTRTASEAIDVTVPQFADVAGLYVLEHLVDGDEVPAGEGDGSVIVRRLAVGSAAGEPHEWNTAFPVDQVMVYPASNPFARCMASGKPLLFSALDSETAEQVRNRVEGHESLTEVLEYVSFLVVPLKARGTVIGFAIFGRRPARAAFDQPDIAVVQEVAAWVATCVDNARLYGQARRTALALQASLLPETLTAPHGLEIAHRYLPASGTTQVGGDWYDAIPLAGDRVALVIGDAMGHDSTAAAAMVQLRTAARTLADLDLQPVDVLYRLDRLAQQMDTAQFATCVYATCDPASRSLAIACAGHIPPILVHAEGGAEVLDLSPGVPLGVGNGTFETMELTMPPGATLALCTDGLVESRDRDIGEGIAALRDALSTPSRSLQHRCDTVIDALRRRRGMDDITLLLARIT